MVLFPQNYNFTLKKPFKPEMVIIFGEYFSI